MEETNPEQYKSEPTQSSKRAKVLQSVEGSLLNEFSISKYQNKTKQKWTLLGLKRLFLLLSSLETLENRSFSASFPTGNIRKS